MRHIFYIFLAMAIMGSACQKKVTDIKPQDLLSSDLAFSSPQKIENAVLSGYDGLQSPEFISGRALIYVDLMGEDIYDRTGYFTELPRFGLLANSGIAYSVWTAGYASVAKANTGIAGITANSNKLTADKAKELIAECKFIRAVANFYLVNFFAQPYVFTSDASHTGIPLITKPFTSNDPAANQPKSSVAAVYTAIITDLMEALADLPLEYTGYANDEYHNKTRGTKASASAFLSRVYLYKGDYTNAKKYALDVINGNYGVFALNSTVDASYTASNGEYITGETIWSIANNINDNPNTNNALPMHYYPNGRGDLSISSSFLSTTTNPYFAVDDKRRTLIISGTTAQTAAYKFTRKYTDITGRADWAPIIRYAEILLTYAEAQARTATGVDADAVAKLNIVRDRAKAITTLSYTVGSFANKDALIAAILGERRIELAFEGHRFWDLMRVKASVTNKYDSDGTSLLPAQPFGAKKNVFPIPQIEIDKSKGVLVQNDDY
ncbi:RagB/SusD family nutrient uptake outer membrane protein [Niastella caeni]|uniref:RagB/SusD family nutrient uptake outer membrane protein n=1 Tax=Niastella caeni TaxID=2569763 RepID=A0A4S8HPA4_9BACT|nr:RagB/SusD family nutrient uptake outer membrane protein [Niastella caeni]THU37230.1 RagB/SusD family nutrient uptake outer membrane protein [Niastella caeni]